MRLLGLGFASLFALTACGTTIDYMATNRAPHRLHPRPVETVDVYSASVPDRPFVEIGIIEAQQSSRLSLDSAPDVFNEMRRAAAERGCDGMIVNGTNDKVVGSSETTVERTRHGTEVRESSEVGTLRGYRATCIVYRAPAPVVSQREE